MNKGGYLFYRIWENPGILGEPVFWVIAIICIIGIIVYKNSNKK